MTITRHFVDIGARRVHYRRCGNGPALLMVHQSPRSSAEYAPLMEAWGAHFTCIAPDTPGFGQSDPLPDADADIGDFADALVALLDALGLERVPAYGFHSGGIILVDALRRHPERFAALAIGGYAVWTPEENALFSEYYLPPFRPQPYGEHLTWLWNRMLEQSWFFPWFAAEPGARLPGAHADVAGVDAAVREMLDAGDAYRVGYGAVLRAPRDIPERGSAMPPVLVTAYDGDPLQAHIDRLGALPAGWSARKVGTPAEHRQASLDFLDPHALGAAPALVETEDQGFVRIETAAYRGWIHWRGTPGGTMTLAGPGRALELLGNVDGVAVDPPGHGLSDPWPARPPEDPAAWDAVIEALAAHFECEDVEVEQIPDGDPMQLFPDLAPDRFGGHLTRAWGVVRAAHLFSPWYAAGPENAIDFVPEALDSERLAAEHRALLRASAARIWWEILRARQET